MYTDDNIDVIGNVKLIENYKAGLLSSTADLFSTMVKGDRASMDEINEELSEIIIFSYFLGKRLGINYEELDEKIVQKLKLGLLGNNSVEDESQDYSKLISYIKNGREL